MRRKLIAGNWKMNNNLGSATSLAGALKAGVPASGAVEVAVCPPMPYLLPVRDALRGSAIALGAQDLHWAKSGAYTGEVSAEMLADVGAKFVIIGHSERRHTIGHLEDDRMVNLKVRAAQRAGLVPILCVGETLEERQAGETLDVLTFQTIAGLVNVDLAKPLAIAYEPVWAIGTGQNATPAQAQEAHAHIREDLRRLGGGRANEVQILYGGSMKPENAGELLGQPDVDGGLVGGASLKADSFLGIIRAGLALSA